MMLEKDARVYILHKRAGNCREAYSSELCGGGEGVERHIQLLYIRYTYTYPYPNMCVSMFLYNIIREYYMLFIYM